MQAKSSFIVWLGARCPALGPGLVVHARNSSTQEAEVRGSQVQDHLLPSKAGAGECRCGQSKVPGGCHNLQMQKGLSTAWSRDTGVTTPPASLLPHADLSVLWLTGDHPDLRLSAE